MSLLELSFMLVYTLELIIDKGLVFCHSIRLGLPCPWPTLLDNPLSLLELDRPTLI